MTDNNEQETKAIMNPDTTTVSQLVQGIIQQRLEAGVLENAIAKQVDEMINTVCRDVFRSYGDVGKALKEKLTAAIAPKIEDLTDLPPYHDMVMARLKLAAKDFHDNRLVEAVDAELKKVMEELPTEATFSWIMKEMIDSAREEQEESEGELTLIIENNTDGFIHVCIDKKSRIGKYQCDIRFQARQVNRDNSDEAPKFEIFALNIDGRDKSRYGTALAFGTHYQFEKKLINLYALKGTITMDEGLDAYNYNSSWSDD